MAKKRLVPPKAVDHFAKVTDWGLYENDQFGVCGPTGAANFRKMITLYLTGTEASPTQDDVFALYKLQNPDFDPATGAGDNGVDLQTMCEDLVKVGIGGVKALGFFKVDVANAAERKECVTLLGAILLGVNLENAQQEQTDLAPPRWSYSKSAEWGGHCILHGKYEESIDDNISWAEDIQADKSFQDEQYSEGWGIIWPEHTGLVGFQEGIDLQRLAADYKQLTGRDFPMTNPNDPVPTPADPAPVQPGLEEKLRQDWDNLVQKVRDEVKAEGGPVVEQLKGDAKNVLTEFRDKINQFLSEHGLE
jgi:hypothetical protein